MRPHILAFPFPSQGHINPMLLLCHKLSEMGAVITFLNTTTYHERLMKNKQIENTPSFQYITISDACLPKDRLGNNLQMFLNAIELMREDFECLLDGLMKDSQRPPVTCVLCDAFIAWTQDVAIKFGICRASFWTSCSSWALVGMHFPLLRQHHLLPAQGSTRRVDFIPGLPPISARSLPDTIQFEDNEYDPGFKPRQHRSDIMRDDAWVFVNSVYEMEPQQLDQLKKENPNFVPIGPLLPPGYLGKTVAGYSTGFGWKEDLHCLDWLDRQDTASVLYVSFGSVATVPLQLVETILTGVEKSGCTFLWVMRLDFIENNEDRNHLLSRIEQNKKGLVISWAPQLKVLQHKAVAAFLTHCGWNSLTEAAVAGVPLLCMPRFGDQVLNCAVMVDILKIGLRVMNDELDKSSVSAEKIEEGVRAMMGGTGEQMRKKAKELSDAALRAVQEGGSSHNNLRAFVEDMKKRQRKP